jgi:hypothetical protein
MAVRELWRDRERGDVWVVELEPCVVACAGPFDPDEISDEMLDRLECAEARSGWIQRHRDRFEPWAFESPEPAAEIWPT